MSLNLKGAIGEDAACNYLIKKGFIILKRNFTCRFGELDIIAKNKEYILFVEVKARGERALASPCEFVTKSKQRKIITTSLYYLSQNKSDLQPRYDVFEVTINDNLPPEVININHIENAFLTHRR